MHIKKLICLFMLGCGILLEGCFEVVEQVVLKNDGSGNFQLVVNMSKSKTKINSLIKMQTVNGRPVPTKEEITQKIAEIENTLQKTKGISDVTTKLDFNNFIATLTCTFDKVSSLNTAIKNINDKEKSKDNGLEKSYAYDGMSRIFTRLNKFSLKTAYEKLSNADREVFATANYTGIFRFESGIAAFSNTGSKLSADKKAIMLKENALDIITGKKQIENKITLTK